MLNKIEKIYDKIDSLFIVISDLLPFSRKTLVKGFR